MKTKILIATLFVSALATGCVKDSERGSIEPTSGGFTINATQSSTTATDPGLPTDTTLAKTNTMMAGNVLNWADGDALGVVKKTDGSVNARFSVRGSDISADGKTAKFTGAVLDPGDYIAYYPYKATPPLLSSSPHLLTGQTQEANTTTHLGAYDFLISDPATVSQGDLSENFVFHHSLALLQLGFRVKTAGTNVEVKSVTLKAHDALGNPVNVFAQGIYYGPADEKVLASQTGPEITLTINNSPTLSATQDNLTANLVVLSQADSYPYFIDIVVDTDKNPITIANARTVVSSAGEFEAGRFYPKTFILDANDTRSVPSDLFRSYLVSLGFKLTPDGMDIDLTNSVNTALFQSTTQLNPYMYALNNGLIGANGYVDIGTMKGLELFPNLQILNIVGIGDSSNPTDNFAVRLDLSGNKKLTNLLCSGAHLYPFDVSMLPDLAYLYMTNMVWPPTSPATIDVSANTKLVHLYIDGNKFTSIDVSKNTLLTQLNIQQNQISSLDISKNTLLDRLYCQQNLLTSLNITKNTLLTTLECGDQGTSSSPLTLSLTMTLAQKQVNWATWLAINLNTLRVNVLTV